MLKGLSLLAAHEMGGSLRRRITAIGYFAGAALLACVAAIYGLNGLHDWLIPLYSPMLANLMIAGGLTVLAVIVAIIGMVQKRRTPDTSALASAALIATPLAVRGLGKLNVGTIATIGVLVGGALLGRQISKS